MSMDQSAVKEIQKSDATQAVNQAVNDAITSPTAVCSLPSDFGMVNLERYLPNRLRMRGKMETTVIADFARYVKKNELDGSTCFLDPEAMRAVAVLNIGDKEVPGHCDFNATLRLQKTSEYKALLTADGSRSSQKELAEWIEDWRDNLVFFDAEGVSIETRRAIGAVRRLTIESSRREDHEDQQFAATKSALESIEAKGDGGMPSGFRFTCVPYKSLNEHSFEARISIITGGDAPKLTVRVKQLELEQERIAEDFKRILEDALVDTNTDLYLGEFDS